MANAESESARLSNAESDATTPRDPGRGGKTAPGTRLPERLSPQLATPVEEPPTGEWRYEVQFHGYRLLTRIEQGEVRLYNRNHQDWTDRLKLHADALAGLDLGDSWLDGELVLLDETGHSDFAALREAFEISRTVDMVYFLFDAPFLNGVDLRQAPVEERRAALKKALGNNASKRLRFSEWFSASQHDMFESAIALSLDSVVGKRLGSPYMSRRSADWVKLKCRLRQAFVIVGFTRPQGKRSGFGALLLAVNGATGLVYAGRVGTGFSQVQIKQLHEQLCTQQRESSPLAEPINGTQGRGVQWVEPTLTCEVEFTEWTRDNQVRQAIFLGLPLHTPANKVVREQPLPIKPSTPKPQRRKKASTAKVDGVTITHPERVIDSVSGVQKAELAQYYLDRKSVV